MSSIHAVCVKQLRAAAEGMPTLQPGEDARSLCVDGVELPMVRLLVQLSFPIMLVEAAYKMCIAGDTTGSMAFYFYPDAVSAEGRPHKRVLVESEDVRSSGEAVQADYRLAADRRAHKFPMKPNQYYMVHGTPHHDVKSTGLPATTASLSVVHVRPLTGDFNELTHHYLECIHHHLLRTRGAPPFSSPSSSVKPPAPVVPVPRPAPASVKGDEAAFFFDDADGDEDAASDML
jgi:hypothetical protein